MFISSSQLMTRGIATAGVWGVQGFVAGVVLLALLLMQVREAGDWMRGGVGGVGRGAHSNGDGEDWGRSCWQAKEATVKRLLCDQRIGSS